jgi:hypothetical protein
MAGRTLKTVICCNLMHHLFILLASEAVRSIRVKQMVRHAITSVGVKTWGISQSESVPYNKGFSVFDH